MNSANCAAGLLGANGAGKTTLLRMILGLLAPTRDSIALLGGRPTRQRRRRLGYVPQALGLYTDLTVEESVQFSAHAFGAAPPTLDRPADLRSLADRLASDIGLGRQRQLAFACALAHRPQLLVLDEPTSGVDALTRTRLWDAIHDHADQGGGTLVTTHFMQEAEQCDRLVVMAHGRVAAQGSAADIVGDTTATEMIRATDWSGAFTALDLDGVAVSLSGRAVRATCTSAAHVAAILKAADVEAAVAEVPATLDEAMLAINRSA